MKQKSILGTLTVYNSKKEVSYQSHIDKSELDDTIRNYKEEGRKLEGVFYLNGEVDVIIPSRGFTEQTVRIVFTPDNVSRETSQIKWEAGIDQKEWLMKEVKSLLDIEKKRPTQGYRKPIGDLKFIDCTNESNPEPDKILEAVNFRPHVEGSISRLSNELQVSSFIQQRFTKHF